MGKFTEDDRKVIEFGIQHNLGIRYKEAAQNLLDDRDTARASEAMLREALLEIDAPPPIQRDQDDGLRWKTCAWCCRHVEGDDEITHLADCPVVIARAALSCSSGAWLERQLAEARRKALMEAAVWFERAGDPIGAEELRVMARQEADHA